MFAGRKPARFVRECHGDMHLGNMILEGDAITIFDCIEFNESLRWIDVMSEVAFCTMDLADHGRPDFAWRFLNAVLEWSGDYEGLRVFPLYFTYRALVRAKVACIRLNQAGLPADEKSHATSALSKYLQLAGWALSGGRNSWRSRTACRAAEKRGARRRSSSSAGPCGCARMLSANAWPD